MSRLDRFKRLEAPRTERTGDGAKHTEERFSRVEEERAPGEAPPPRRPPAQRMQRQVSDQPLALDPRPTEEQQFIRCMHCEADNSRYAQDCIHCGASLQTGAQRDWNEQFWRRRQSEAAQEQQAVEQFHAGKKELTKEQAEAQAAAYAAMLQEAQEAQDVPPGVRLLRAIQDPVKQWTMVGVLVAVAVGSGVLLQRSRPDQLGVKVACGAALLILAVLFIPPSWWTRRSRRRSFWFDDYDDFL